MKALINVRLETSRLGWGFPDSRFPVEYLDKLGAGCGRRVLEALHPELSRRGLGRIKRRHSNTAGEGYLSAGCLNCDAIYGRHYAVLAALDADAIFRVEASFTVPEIMGSPKAGWTCGAWIR